MKTFSHFSFLLHFQLWQSQLGSPIKLQQMSDGETWRRRLASGDVGRCTASAGGQRGRLELCRMQQHQLGSSKHLQQV
jgi:hypothetical protein